jgi:hypothetical protein
MSRAGGGAARWPGGGCRRTASGGVISVMLTRGSAQDGIQSTE